MQCVLEILYNLHQYVLFSSSAHCDWCAAPPQKLSMSAAAPPPHPLQGTWPVYNLQKQMRWLNLHYSSPKWCETPLTFETFLYHSYIFQVYHFYLWRHTVYTRNLEKNTLFLNFLFTDLNENGPTHTEKVSKFFRAADI